MNEHRNDRRQHDERPRGEPPERDDVFGDELISAYLDGELAGAERAAVEERLATNADFRQAVEELRALRSHFELLPQYQLESSFAEKVIRRSEREVLIGGAPLPQDRHAPALASQVEASASSAADASPDRSGSLRPFVWAFLAVAAGLLIMVLNRAPDIRLDPIARGPDAPALEGSKSERRGGELDEATPDAARTKAKASLPEQVRPRPESDMAADFAESSNTPKSDAFDSDGDQRLPPAYRRELNGRNFEPGNEAQKNQQFYGRDTLELQRDGSAADAPSQARSEPAQAIAPSRGARMSRDRAASREPALPMPTAPEAPAPAAKPSGDLVRERLAAGRAVDDAEGREASTPKPTSSETRLQLGAPIDTNGAATGDQKLSQSQETIAEEDSGQLGKATQRTVASQSIVNAAPTEPIAVVYVNVTQQALAENAFEQTLARNDIVVPPATEEATAGVLLTTESKNVDQEFELLESRSKQGQREADRLSDPVVSDSKSEAGAAAPDEVSKEEKELAETRPAEEMRRRIGGKPAPAKERFRKDDAGAAARGDSAPATPAIARGAIQTPAPAEPAPDEEKMAEPAEAAVLAKDDAASAVQLVLVCASPAQLAGALADLGAQQEQFPQLQLVKGAPPRDLFGMTLLGERLGQSTTGDSSGLKLKAAEEATTRGGAVRSFPAGPAPTPEADLSPESAKETAVPESAGRPKASFADRDKVAKRYAGAGVNQSQLNRPTGQTRGVPPLAERPAVEAKPALEAEVKQQSSSRQESVPTSGVGGVAGSAGTGEAGLRGLGGFGGGLRSGQAGGAGYGNVAPDTQATFGWAVRLERQAAEDIAGLSRDEIQSRLNDAVAGLSIVPPAANTARDKAAIPLATLQDAQQQADDKENQSAAERATEFSADAKPQAGAVPADAFALPPAAATASSTPRTVLFVFRVVPSTANVAGKEAVRSSGGRSNAEGGPAATVPLLPGPTK